LAKPFSPPTKVLTMTVGTSLLELDIWQNSYPKGLRKPYAGMKAAPVKANAGIIHPPIKSWKYIWHRSGKKMWRLVCKAGTAYTIALYFMRFFIGM